VKGTFFKHGRDVLESERGFAWLGGRGRGGGKGGNGVYHDTERVELMLEPNYANRTKRGRKKGKEGKTHTCADLGTSQPICLGA